VIARTRHLLYIDESGGHALTSVDPNWPVFVLVGLLVGEIYYAQTLVPRLKKLKSTHGLPRETVLHSRSIRRHEGAFAFLAEKGRREALYTDLNRLFESSRLRIYAVVIDKRRHARRFLFPPSPYDVSLGQLLSTVCGPPGLPTRWRPNVVRVTAESRGKKEDRQLQAEYQNFRRLGVASYGADGVQARRPTTFGKVFPERIEFVRKSRGVSGLELADLAAYPIGRAYITQAWDNPAYLALSRRVRSLICFP
jgi:hypothetical protein